MTQFSIDQSTLKSLLHYDPESGLFSRLRFTNGKAANPGTIVGSVSEKNGVMISFRGKRFYAHRLAWLYMTGEWPSGEIDHIDRNRLNNSWANLRVASRSGQQQNVDTRSDNTSGQTGVYWRSNRNRWVARIQVGGKVRILGSFKNLEEAKACYLEGKRVYHTFNPVV